jgi:hypothetical protein
MSYFTAIDSACGRITTRIDIFDLDLNPHGVICCGECRTIIQSREAWLSDPYATIDPYDDFTQEDYDEMYGGWDD